MSEQTPFEKRTREVLDESTAKLDGRTLSRLNQARHAALSGRDRPERHRWRSLVPAGAAAAALVIAVMVWTGPGADTSVQLASSGGAFEDIDLLADGDAPDFITDDGDVDFYEWAGGETES